MNTDDVRYLFFVYVPRTYSKGISNFIWRIDTISISVLFLNSPLHRRFFFIFTSAKAGMLRLQFYRCSQFLLFIQSKFKYFQYLCTCFLLTTTIWMFYREFGNLAQHVYVNAITSHEHCRTNKKCIILANMHFRRHKVYLQLAYLRECV